MGPSAFTSIPGWDQGRAGILMLKISGGTAASDRASRYGQTYQGRRAAMVFDVVASAQRKYTSHVLPMVTRFEQTDSAVSLVTLAERGVPESLGLREREPATIRGVAAGLVAFALEHNLDEESGIKVWAEYADAFKHAPKLDPYVGAVSGIGPALFAYLRMRCGADAIKPDSRVGNVLAALGFPHTSDEHSRLVLAEAVAQAAGIGLLELDQLLWWAEETKPWLSWTQGGQTEPETEAGRAARIADASQILFAAGKMTTADGKSWGELHPELNTSGKPDADCGDTD